MSNNTWQVCRDGLKPLIQAVSRVEEPDIGEIVEWLRAGADPFCGLRDNLINVSLKTWVFAEPHTPSPSRRDFAKPRTPSPSRRDMVRQWLQSNGYEADAREFDTRLENLIGHLKEWERVARQEADRRKNIWKAKDEAGEFLELFFIIDERGCDALNDVSDEASGTRSYLWQLDRSIQNKLGKQDAVTKLQKRLDTIDESLNILKAGDTPHQPETAAESVKPTREVEHSTDFRSVWWCGQDYTFTPNQAACVKLLWENWERGTPDVGEQTILEFIDSNQDRLRDIFVKGEHPAWGTMIKPGDTKGAFRLAKSAIS